jgi:hypothetical protein
MTRYSKPRYAAQIRKSDGAVLLTRTVTDPAVPLFESAQAAHDSLTVPPAEHPAITAEMWADYISAGEIEVWKIRIDYTGTRRAEYIPASAQPRNIAAS